MQYHAIHGFLDLPQMVHGLRFKVQNPSNFITLE